jgi:hypothetical protein
MTLDREDRVLSWCSALVHASKEHLQFSQAHWTMGGHVNGLGVRLETAGFVRDT